MTSAHSRYDQRILYRECVSLFDAGYDVTLLVNDVIKNEEVKGVKITSTGKSYKGKRWRRMLFGVNSIFKLAQNEDADIYHFHDPELMRVATKLKRKGKIVVYDSHEIYRLQIKEKRYLPSFLRNIIASIYVWYESYILKRIAGVIFPVKTDKVDFESIARVVAYVNNVPRMDELPERYSETKKEGVCYTGGLTYERGILHLAKAARIANVPLYIAGSFESELFMKQVLEENENGLIHYLGVINREEVYQLYNKCSIGVSTLLPIGQYAVLENLPTKVYEYMAIGLPVILSDIPFNRSVIEKYNFGMLVNPEKPREIAEAIVYLVEHPEKMKEMGENGKRLIFQEWNWKVEEEKLLNFYKKIQEK